MNKNDIITLEITAMSSDGSGIGRKDGAVVFVPFTSIGDKAEVKILRVQKNCSYGKVEKLVNPSGARCQNNCPSFIKCGGCAYRHIDYSEELKYKTQRVIDAMSRIGKLDVNVSDCVASPLTEQYRNKAQYPIGLGDNGDILIGFYAKRSHRIIDAENCKIQPEIFSQIIKLVKHWVKTFNIPVYNEVTGKGLLRHLYLRKGEITGEVLVCLVATKSKIAGIDALVSALRKKVPNLKSVIVNINSKNTNVILGQKCITVFGDDYITDELAGVKVKLSPLSFYQVNTLQANNLYKEVTRLLDPTGNETVIDLYCGVGTIGLSVANKVKRLIGVEIIEDAVKNAKENANLNNITNAEFYCGDASNLAKSLEKEKIEPDAIIVDPPRKGLTPELINTINEMHPSKIIYVSCDCATMARDLAQFKELGYNISNPTPFDMFPRTPHVETICCITK